MTVMLCSNASPKPTVQTSQIIMVVHCVYIHGMLLRCVLCSCILLKSISHLHIYNINPIVLYHPLTYTHYSTLKHSALHRTLYFALTISATAFAQVCHLRFYSHMLNRWIRPICTYFSGCLPCRENDARTEWNKTNWNGTLPFGNVNKRAHGRQRKKKKKRKKVEKLSEHFFSFTLTRLHFTVDEWKNEKVEWT